MLARRSEQGRLVYPVSLMLGGLGMARRNGNDTDGKDKPAIKSGTLVKDYDAPFRGYINLNLSDEEKLAWEKWNETAHLWAWFDSACEDGVNFSVKLDPKGQGALASATQRRTTSPNAGLVCTARGGSPSVALSRVVYIISLLSAYDRWEERQPLANPDRW